MNEKLVTSLSISQQMKEAGIEQSSEFYWVVSGGESELVAKDSKEIKEAESAFDHGWLDVVICSAFTSGEMGEMLPAYAQTWKLGNLSKEKVGYFCCSYDDLEEIAETEADARGLMLLHLKKEGLIGKEGG